MDPSLAAAHERLVQAFDELSAAAATVSGLDHCAVLSICESVSRRVDRLAVSALAAAEHEDVFGAHGYRTSGAALADLLRWEPRRSRRFVTAADQVVPGVEPDGAERRPTLPSTASGFDAGDVSMRHVEVIASVLGTKVAHRIAPEKWTAAEEALAGRAPDCTPAELYIWGTRLVDTLDEDGPAVPEPQINELRIVRHRRRPGGTLRGRFDDAEMWDRIVTVLDAHAGPGTPDDPRDKAERQADALADVCGYALAHAPSRILPESGGRRPQLTVTVRMDDLEQRASAATVDLGGQLTPTALRMLACDAAVIPVVLGGRGEPLDVGRARRTVPDGLRRAVAARDRGCGFPGCDRPPGWCEIHHVLPWEHGGTTEIRNLAMLCRAHHRLVHHAGWIVRITDGRPEFVPPEWIDPRRRPRRKPGTDPTLDRPPDVPVG